jgi:choline kinase
MRTKINNKELGVWLPNKLFKNLKEQLDEYNQLGIKPMLNLAKAAYLLNLLFYLPIKAKDKYEDGWIPICSELIKNIKGYAKYISFLKEKGFIIESYKNYSTSSGKCKSFRLGGTYMNHVIDYQLITDNTYFIKKLNEFKLDRMKTADDKCLHLTKWLNPDLLEIDYDKAIKYTQDNYKGTGNIRKKNKRIFAIKSIHNKSWTYSREGNDNRLHSILTSLPKDLRCYVKYNNESLISFDIKNSQPFIYASILNQVINYKINLIKCFINNTNHMLYTSIMCDLFRDTLNSKEIQVFINQVLEGTFYETYGDILYNEAIISENVNNECYIINVTKTPTQFKREPLKFNSRRNVAKHIILKTLFSSKDYHSDIINIFKKHYSEVYKVTQIIKGTSEAKNFFPILLQNIEADCVLDYCTDKMAKHYPEMPLFTIHDSIITTSEYQSILEEEFKKSLKIYFGLDPKLHEEPWNVELSNAS